MKWSPSVAWWLLSVIRAQQPTVKARRLFLLRLPDRLKLFSSLWPLSVIYPSLQNKTSLHITFKHSYFLTNHILGVRSAAKSCTKIKHCLRIFSSLGYFFIQFMVWSISQAVIPVVERAMGQVLRYLGPRTTLPLTSCLTVGQSFEFSGPRFPQV